MPFAFGRDRKMRKTDEFSSVFRFRCVRGGAGLDVLAAPNGLDYARLGLIVPKKIISTAAGRNRVKRLLREGFRLYQMELAGLDVVARLKARVEEDSLKSSFQTGMAQCKACVENREKGDVVFPVPV
jgi:ribonuclease P protein component